MKKNVTWTLWSHVILILLLVVDTHVHAESSYGRDVKGCILLLLYLPCKQTLQYMWEAVVANTL